MEQHILQVLKVRMPRKISDKLWIPQMDNLEHYVIVNFVINADILPVISIEM